MFSRLRNRLLLVNMLLISVVMIAAFVSIYLITSNSIKEENLTKLQSLPFGTSPAVALPIDLGPDSKLVYGKTFIGKIPLDYATSFAVLTDMAGEIVDISSYVDISEQAYLKMTAAAFSLGKPDGVISYGGAKWQFSITSLIQNKLLNGNQIAEITQYRRIGFLNISESSRTLTQLLLTFILVGVLALCTLFGVSLHFANRSIRPIEESWQKQQQFVANASHELKTPLAIISANTDALLANSEETVNSQQKWIGYIQAEIGRMSRLVNDMLFLAKTEDTCASQAPFDLSNAALDAVATMEAVIFEKGISLTQTIEPEVVVKGDDEEIRRVILILFDNAAKYTNEHGQINVRLRRVRNSAVFSIQNSGEGIPEEELPRIFDRFYRTDPSRSQETGGYGLGLSIAKAVIDRYGGSIRAESTPESTTFTFELKI